MTDDALLLDRQLCFALYAATRAMVQAYEPLLAKIGVTYPQYLVLLVLWEADGVSVKELGDRLYLDSGTLTPLLKRLDAAGIVKRERSTVDERVVLVHLTAKGKRLKKDAVGIPAEMFCKTGLSLDKLGKMRAELMKVFGALKKEKAA